MVPRFLRYFLALVVLAVIFLGPLFYKWQRDADLRNLRVVREGVLYRSGQLSLYGLKRVIHDYGIKTVISLREAHVRGDRHPDKEEEDFCRKEGYSFFRIPVKDERHQASFWEGRLGPTPADQSMAEFCRIRSDPANHPVLIHCYGGIHRAGAFSAVYRMEFEGWSNDRAIDEMRDLGYSTIDDEWDILGYLEA